MKDELVKKSDQVTVSIVERMSFGWNVPSIAPFSSLNESSKFKTVRRDWRLIDLSTESKTEKRKRRYSYTTHAFTNGIESPFLPEYADCIRTKGIMTQQDGIYFERDYSEFPKALNVILDFRDKILASDSRSEGNKLAQAIQLEDYFANSGVFKYSMVLTGPVDKAVDPVADFILNKKVGHCQYFASSLALLLRSLNIPSRMVIGYRPQEFNDVGQYFSVQQNHAHVWVEAYFESDDLKKKFPDSPTWIGKGAWVRLDPTPPGEGSNAGGTLRTQDGQALDAMQDLWSEMVLNLDQSKQSSIFSLFGESSSRSYLNFWTKIKESIDQMQTSHFIGGFLSPDRWFSWRVALGIILLGSSAVALYRILLWLFPMWMPQVRLRSLISKSKNSGVDFYERASKALKHLGLQRSKHQTQEEFLRFATAQLGGSVGTLDLTPIARMFYERRFGGAIVLNETDQKLLDETIRKLESKTIRNRYPK